MALSQSGSSLDPQGKAFVFILVLAFAAFMTWAATAGNKWSTDPEPAPTPSITAQP